MFEARRRGIGHKLETAICRRLIGLDKRLRSVLARWYAGTLGPPRPRAPRVERVREVALGQEAAARPGLAPPDWRGLIPRKFGWLRQLLGPRVGEATLWFVEPLGGAEMQAILAKAPQVGRILRPFHHFLGLELPAELRLPKRRRKKDTSPRPSPQGGEGEEGEGGGDERLAHPSPRLVRFTAQSPSRGEGGRELPPHPDAALFPDTPAAREAARYLARVQAGLPADVDKLSSVAYGYVVHRPRGELLTPHEIGYAGKRRRWRDSKKDD